MSRRNHLTGAALRTAVVPWVASWVALVVVSISAGVAVAEPASDTSTPREIVDSLHNELLSVMKEADSLGYRGRFSRLKPVLDELFDIPFMAKKSVGRHWKTVDDQQQAHLLATFERFTVANYAGRFSAYSDQEFETLKVVESTHGTFLVHSKLISPSGETVQLNYRLRPVDKGWRIIDVYLNGTVSELALRRSEYSSLIQREGFDALLKALEERISILESEELDKTKESEVSETSS